MINNHNALGKVVGKMGYFGATRSIGRVNILKGFVWEGDRRE